MTLECTLCERYDLLQQSEVHTDRALARESRSKPFCDSIGTAHCVNVMFYSNKGEVPTLAVSPDQNHSVIPYEQQTVRTL